ncbi:hypothetical protein Q4S45_19515 [Massilia sp. R2A-15]|uniref:hypothetical protein n=1 Tax=Massilia sp. R2A-15 TaxID=3064278 RepID=UPI0027330F59|nr:hypothetical protein [Massilia sp. R2A-15]WLI88867.1 hypothetical protein Q4S45_19515 [Massilia sp. R2A-15]
MQLLSPSQCSDWLALRRIQESPYGSRPAMDTWDAQFRIGRNPHAAHAAMVAAVCGQPLRKDVLIQITDWSSFETEPLPDSLNLLQDAYDGAGLKTFWSGGVVFTPNDELTLEECCQFIQAEGMSAYLYAPSPQVTLYFWEGDILDVWTSSEISFGSINSSLLLAGARLIHAV